MDDTAGIYARELPGLDRSVQLGIAQGRVISVSFPDQPEADAVTEHELLDRIEDYFQTVEETFTDVTVALTVPTDQRDVLENVRGIPHGTEIGRKKLTSMTAGLDSDDEEDRRLVDEALRANPAPLLIPDHRVRDGSSAAPSDVVQQLRSVEGF